MRNGSLTASFYHKGTEKSLPMRRFRGHRLDPSNRMLQLMQLTPDIMQLLHVVSCKKLFAFDFQLADFMLQIGLRVNHGFGEMRMRTLDAQDVRNFIH